MAQPTAPLPDLQRPHIPPSFRALARAVSLVFAPGTGPGWRWADTLRETLSAYSWPRYQNTESDEAKDAANEYGWHAVALARGINLAVTTRKEHRGYRLFLLTRENLITALSIVGNDRGLTAKRLLETGDADTMEAVVQVALFGYELPRGRAGDGVGINRVAHGGARLTLAKTSDRELPYCLGIDEPDTHDNARAMMNAADLVWLRERAAVLLGAKGILPALIDFASHPCHGDATYHLHIHTKDGKVHHGRVSGADETGVLLATGGEERVGILNGDVERAEIVWDREG